MLQQKALVVKRSLKQVQPVRSNPPIFVDRRENPYPDRNFPGRGVHIIF